MMKFRRNIKKVALIIFTIMFISRSSFMVRANESYECTHGGKNFNKEKHTHEVGRKLILDRFPGVEHPCYVQGKLVSCKTYYDKYEVYYACNHCKKVIITTFEFTDLEHQYFHD